MTIAATPQGRAGNLNMSAIQTVQPVVEAFEQAIDITGNAAILVHFGLPNEGDVIHVPALSTHTMDKEIRFSWLAPFPWLGDCDMTSAPADSETAAVLSVEPSSTTRTGKNSSTERITG